MEITLNPKEDAIKIITANQAFEWNILPLQIENGCLFIATATEPDKKLMEDIKFFTGHNIKTVIVPSEILVGKIRTIYGEAIKENLRDKAGILIEQQNEFSNVDMVNRLIEEAIYKQASDIHLESLEGTFRIRYRIDGRLREIMNLPVQRSAQITSRLKIMAGLDISEKRKPQDGKIKFRYKTFDVDIRVSTLPTTFGEKTVLRILDKSNINLDIDFIGLTEEQLSSVKRILQLPFGMILVTGPTGSGKSTTLYSFLQHIDSIEKNILTIEDPIEYHLNGISQCNVKPDIGYDFATALRAFLRQDPDIIMVGEIRDKETADIAVRAALTGHLVFSTLHTNDSVTAITRLIDMGVDAFLVAASLKLVIAQRLVRRLCSCKVISEITRKDSAYHECFRKKGCIECGMTGYKGRTALFEVLEITDEIAEEITTGAKVSNIKNKAYADGFTTLRQSGLLKIQTGITTNEEVIKETAL